MMIEDAQKLIEITELVGRNVSVDVEDRDECIDGKLHAITNHGIFVREHSGGYYLIPWMRIMLVKHGTKKETENTDSETTEFKDVDKAEIRRALIRKVIEDYDTDYRTFIDDEDIVIELDGDEIYRVTQNTFVVYHEDWISDAKDIFKTLKLYGITEIERHYEE